MSATLPEVDPSFRRSRVPADQEFSRRVPLSRRIPAAAPDFDRRRFAGHPRHYNQPRSARNYYDDGYDYEMEPYRRGRDTNAVPSKVQFASDDYGLYPDEDYLDGGRGMYEFRPRQSSDPGRRPSAPFHEGPLQRKSVGTELSLAGINSKKKTKPKKSMSSGNLSILSEQSGCDRKWNVFRSVSRHDEDSEPKWTVIGAQVFKVVVYIILHAVVLGCGFVSKMILLLMVSNLRPTVYYTACSKYGQGETYINVGEKEMPENSVTWFYWSLWIAFCAPEVFTIIRCVRIVLFKFIPAPGIFIFAGAFLVESARTVGMCLLVFIVLPQLDAIRAAMLLCAVANIPALLLFLTHFSKNLPTKSCFLSLLDAIALVSQIMALWIWPAVDTQLKNAWLYPLSLVLASLGWWENFVSKSAELKVISWLGRVKEQLQRSRYKTHMVLAAWKCALSLFCMIMSAASSRQLRAVFDLTNPLSNVTNLGEPEVERAAYSRSVLLLLLLLVLTSMICYQCAKFACKVKMERFSYAIPVVSVIPATIVVLASFCEAKKENSCHFASWLLPDKIFWLCNYGDFVDGLIGQRAAWVWVLWFLSYLWTVAHIFLQKPSRLSKTDTLFVHPMYDGWMVDQSLALNRRRYHIGRVKTKDLNEDQDFQDDASIGSESSDMSLFYSMTSLSLANRNADSITKIYICATMWHETTTEMKQMLKSIMRMDEEQCARKNAQKYLRVVDPDYFELEAHIFFDDAWEDDPELDYRVPNAYVRQLLSVVNEAASAVHKVPIELKAPCKIDLQYGGKLVWTLPGENRLFVHIKDNKKVRHKKRWSQVMYMYFLLGHRIMELIQDTGRKQQLADNTYLLTIDGDSKFTPSSVQKLVDLMKKHSKLGAACGRIHPIGSGLMVWYQKFEYAIAHWFQKATEHVFGCVLCAPGCFSMFRGSALMDDNVMNKYTKLPSEPRHYVQYDQGEDRWLSTLILKQGYRIEYAAAADAQTYAPEGFDEFFNQRRRWTPSSIANTLDLLSDYKKAVKNNDSISQLYVLYQTMVIFFSLLGPAIIFTMLIFAQVAAFHIRGDKVMWANLVPVLVFCILCFIAGSKAQLIYARFIGIIYAFIMMAVLVGTGIQIAAEGVGSPTSIFVISLTGVFTFAAFFHPREFPNIFYGAVFFLMIPCTYIFMSLYSLINLNVITWGTREAALRAVGKDVAGTMIQQWLRKVPFLRKEREVPDKAKSGKIACDCQRFCQCFICPDEEKPDPHEDHLIWIGEKLENLDGKLQNQASLSRAARRGRSDASREETPSPFPGMLPSSTPNAQQEPVPEIRVIHSDVPEAKKREEPKQDAAVVREEPKTEKATEHLFADREAPAPGEEGQSFESAESLTDVSEKEVSGSPAKSQWMDVDYLKSGPNDIVDELEGQFWTGFIEEYLKPIQKTHQEEGGVVVGLRKLRNNIAFAILVANGLLVLVLYLLQNNKDILSIEITPYENYTWRKYSTLTGKLETVQEPLKVEPIGLTIIVFLSLILAVQTVGMLIHRFHTASHVLASTVLSCFKRRKSRKVDGDQELEEHAVDIARNLQKLDDDYDNLDADFMSPEGRKRKREDEERRVRKRHRVVYNLEQAKNRRKRVKGLQSAFQNRFLGFSGETDRREYRNRSLRGGRRSYRESMGPQNMDRFYPPDMARQIATAEAFRRRREDLLKEETIEKAPSRLRSHLTQPGRSVALHGRGRRRVNRELGPSPIFGGKSGKPDTFLDEISLELTRTEL